jgi:hypothetical protein
MVTRLLGTQCLCVRCARSRVDVFQCTALSRQRWRTLLYAMIFVTLGAVMELKPNILSIRIANYAKERPPTLNTIRLTSSVLVSTGFRIKSRLIRPDTLRLLQKLVWGDRNPNHQ